MVGCSSWNGTRSAAITGMRLMRRIVMAVLIAGSLCVGQPASAGLVNGVVNIVGGVLEVPRSILVGATQFFPLGAVLGALTGTVRGVGMVLHGTLEVIGSAIPIAKKLAPLIPIFI